MLDQSKLQEQMQKALQQKRASEAVTPPKPDRPTISQIIKMVEVDILTVGEARLFLGLFPEKDATKERMAEFQKQAAEFKKQNDGLP